MKTAIASAMSDYPIGDLIAQVAARVEPILATFGLKVTLYHAGGHGIGARDSLGCKVVPMRTAAVDGVTVRRHELLFIKETVGLPMPDGRRHDGYWYASDVGGAIHKGRIDLFTGQCLDQLRHCGGGEGHIGSEHENRREQRIAEQVRSQFNVPTIVAGGNPVTEVPGQTPILLVTVTGPAAVTLWLARTA